ncbi:polar amino acid ABC transporter permease [Ornatilinea apprima]|uniref:Polar amino acid ABC transporter permease n=1 Tax=Ornatilinea apprima TaxID=1134406 RepID=A0A0P6XW80_9CHLR|nr:amino acid ABC transporter permease [Ornatilinea apprima]KPL80820.1 polar amino acid ABC transporter permease [Ornatilinea apprima]
MVLEIMGYILQGTFITIAVSVVALPMGLLLGMLLALARVYGGKILSSFAAVYSTVMRAVPPIVLLFILYFIIAGSINISPFWAGSIALGIISSSYQLEIMRGAIQSVGSGQMMAARALGMSRVTAIRHIIIPQALRLAIPPWSNEVALVLKDSSLVYAIGVPEILRRAQFVSARTYQPFLAFSVAALIYFLLTFLSNRLLDKVEEKTRIPGF